MIRLSDETWLGCGVVSGTGDLPVTAPAADDVWLPHSGSGSLSLARWVIRHDGEQFPAADMARLLGYGQAVQSLARILDRAVHFGFVDVLELDSGALHVRARATISYPSRKLTGRLPAHLRPDVLAATAGVRS